MQINESMPDLTEKQGNPANTIKTNYQKLMAIQEPEELKRAALEMVRNHVGKGFSPMNFKKFVARLNQRDDLFGIQKYITDFMLAGAGLAVGEDKISAMASMITEDVHDKVYLTELQEDLKMLAESHGFTVIRKQV